MINPQAIFRGSGDPGTDTSARHFVSPSLNRVRIVHLPGINLPPATRGRIAFELLSAQAVMKMVEPRRKELGLPHQVPLALKEFDLCFVDPSPAVRGHAEEIARQFGANLAYLLLTLKRADSENRAARSEWSDDHWRCWQQVNSIWLGGGLVSGHLGRHAARQALRLVRGSGFPDFELKLSPYGSLLPLLGVARQLPGATSAALVLDFGHTFVKRACAIFEEGALIGLQRLDDVISPCRDDELQDMAIANIEKQSERMVALMGNSWLEAEQSGVRLTPIIGVSLACYLWNGHPYPGEKGCYDRLQMVAENLQQTFSAEVSSFLGRPISVRLFQDGSAAAAVYAGIEQAVVITLGTAIGIGFPPPAKDLLTNAAI